MSIREKKLFLTNVDSELRLVLLKDELNSKAEKPEIQESRKPEIQEAGNPESRSREAEKY